MQKNGTYIQDLRLKEWDLLYSVIFNEEKPRVKKIIFLFGNTGTGKTALVKNLLFDDVLISKSSSPKTLSHFGPSNLQNFYLNIMRMDKSESFLSRIKRGLTKGNKKLKRNLSLKDLINDYVKKRFVLILDEIDKIESKSKLKETEKIFHLAISSNKFVIIAIANDSTFFRNKFSNFVKLNRNSILFVPFEPFTKENIKTYLHSHLFNSLYNDNNNNKENNKIIRELKKDEIERIIELVSAKAFTKKTDLRTSLSLLRKTMEMEFSKKSFSASSNINLNNDCEESVLEKLPHIYRKLFEGIKSLRNCRKDEFFTVKEVVKSLNGKGFGEVKSEEVSEGFQVLENFGLLKLYKNSKVSERENFYYL